IRSVRSVRSYVERIRCSDATWQYAPAAAPSQELSSKSRRAEVQYRSRSALSHRRLRSALPLHTFAARELAGRSARRIRNEVGPAASDPRMKQLQLSVGRTSPV